MVSLFGRGFDSLQLHDVTLRCLTLVRVLCIAKRPFGPSATPPAPLSNDLSIPAQDAFLLHLKAVSLQIRIEDIGQRHEIISMIFVGQAFSHFLHFRQSGCK